MNWFVSSQHIYYIELREILCFWGHETFMPGKAVNQDGSLRWLQWLLPIAFFNSSFSSELSQLASPQCCVLATKPSSNWEFDHIRPKIILFLNSGFVDSKPFETVTCRNKIVFLICNVRLCWTLKMWKLIDFGTFYNNFSFSSSLLDTHVTWFASEPIQRKINAIFVVSM